MRVLGYLDAGTGSIVASAAVAGFAAAAVFFRMGLRRVKMLFSSKARAEYRAEKEALAAAEEGTDNLADAGTSPTT